MELCTLSSSRILLTAVAKIKARIATSSDGGIDLFPRSFILNLPSPNNYVGPDKVFGVEADEDMGIEAVTPLPITRVIDDHAVKRDSNRDPDLEGIIDEREIEGWMPPRLVALDFNVFSRFFCS